MDERRYRSVFSGPDDKCRARVLPGFCWDLGYRFQMLRHA
jgi:hypothetical protein